MTKSNTVVRHHQTTRDSEEPLSHGDLRRISRERVSQKLHGDCNELLATNLDNMNVKVGAYFERERKLLREAVSGAKKRAELEAEQSKYEARLKKYAQDHTHSEGVAITKK